MYNWSTPVRYIRKIGPAKAKELVSCGIETVGDLLEKQPLNYIFPGATDIADASDGMVVIKAKIHHITRGYGSTVVGVLEDETGACKVIWYCGAWAIQSLRPGWIATFWGKMKDGTLQSPKWTTSPNAIKGVYGGQYGTHHDTIRAALKEVLANVELPDLHGDTPRANAFASFHFPHHKYELESAINILKFDECLQLQLALLERRKKRELVKGEVIAI